MLVEAEKQILEQALRKSFRKRRLIPSLVNNKCTERERVWIAILIFDSFGIICYPKSLHYSFCVDCGLLFNLFIPSSSDFWVLISWVWLFLSAFCPKNPERNHDAGTLEPWNLRQRVRVPLQISGTESPISGNGIKRPLEAGASAKTAQQTGLCSM
jgi:hypothetical protein